MQTKNKLQLPVGKKPTVIGGCMTWGKNIINKIKMGFTYEDANTAYAINDVETPVLIKTVNQAQRLRFYGQEYMMQPLEKKLPVYIILFIQGVLFYK